MNFLTLASLLVPVLIVLVIFCLTPFLKSKVQIGIAALLLGLAIVVYFLPNEWFMETEFPILNKSIEETILKVLNQIDMYRVITDYDTTIEGKILSYVPGIVKMCFVYIFFIVEVLITTIVLFIVHMTKKDKKVVKVSVGSGLILVASILIACIPIDACKSLYNTVEDVIGEDNLVKNYPELNKYKKEIDFLDDFFDKVTIDAIDDVAIFSYPVSIFSGSDYNKLLAEINRLELVMKLVKGTGIGILYENPDFSFRDTDKNTFNFEEIKKVVQEVNNSSIYDNMALLYTNDILASFENEISSKTSKEEKIKLKMTQEEFENQYVDILDLLKFVIDYDLVDELETLLASDLRGFITNGVSLLDRLGKEGRAKLSTFGEYEIIVKIKKYLGIENALLAAVYTCLTLYDAMDSWLLEYKQTDLYDAADKFLKIKGVINND